jgi:ATP-dependent DNA helicase PIF1
LILCIQFFWKKYEETQFFQEHGILPSTLDTIECVNDYLISLVLGSEQEYINFDLVYKSDANSEIHSENFTTEFLNDIKCSGIPNHKLKFKVGCPVMMMRNIDQSGGLCNGT